MTNVVPAALPPWTRSADISQFGGHLEKQNRLGIYTHNPKTDISAEQFSSLVDYVARLSYTTPFFVASILSKDGTVEDPEYIQYFGQNGVGITNAPTIERSGAGEITIYLTTTFNDSYLQEGIWAAKAAQITPNQLIATVPVVEITSSGTKLVIVGVNDILFTLTVW
jgi:hypothetical protein